MTSDLHVQAVLASAFRRSLSAALREQRTYVETLEEQGVKDGTAAGFVDLEGDGETIIAVGFPLQFYERPIFTAGLELRDTYAEWGKFPEWSATVMGWQTQTVNDTVLHTGANLAIRTANTHRATLHYSFQARIFTNPSGPDDSVEATQ